MKNPYDYIIIGAGIIGLAIGRAIKKNAPDSTVLILDKEPHEAAHASSRNSGVLHAGFYYTADSLKAKFTVAGNKAMKEYCRGKNIAVNECGKLVVAQNEEELKTLYELEKRGRANGSRLTLIDEAKARELEPNVKTFQKALFSPDTASVNPKEVCQTIKDDLLKLGVAFQFNARYLSRKGNCLRTTQGDFEGKKVINCSGLYADEVAQDFGFGRKYSMLPFKGLYLKYTKNKTDVKMHIYPVPNLKNPFLGVHFTKTSANDIKIGPTAIPAFWRENYSLTENFHVNEFLTILYYQSQLFFKNSFNFRALAFEEIKKYNKSYFISLAQNLVRDIDPTGFTEFTPPGIRAQLLNTQSLKLVQDFLIEADANSIHILNAVSPAFTCAFPFAEYVVKKFIPIS